MLWHGYTTTSFSIIPYCKISEIACKIEVYVPELDSPVFLTVKSVRLPCKIEVCIPQLVLNKTRQNEIGGQFPNWRYWDMTAFFRSH